MATNKSQLEKWLTAQTGKDRQSQARTVENANLGKKQPEGTILGYSMVSKHQ